jgi:hypothetical protein
MALRDALGRFLSPKVEGIDDLVEAALPNSQGDFLAQVLAHVEARTPVVPREDPGDPNNWEKAR